MYTAIETKMKLAILTNEIHTYLITEFSLDETSKKGLSYRSPDVVVAKKIYDLAMALHNLAMNGDEKTILQPFNKREIAYYNNLLIYAATKLPTNLMTMLADCIANEKPFFGQANDN